MKCEECKQSIDYDIEKEKSTIWDFFCGYEGKLCLSCINYENVETLIDMLNHSLVCAICKKIILNAALDDYQGFILNDNNIVLSVPLEHHINYAKDKTITICSQCHSKIHHSKNTDYIKYKPTDIRDDSPDKRNYILVMCVDVVRMLES